MFVFSPKTNFTRLQLALFAGGRSDASLSSNTAVNVAGDAEYVGDTKELRWHASVIGKDRNPHVLHGFLKTHRVTIFT
ncbi:hypothetical protein [Burkholderia cenocepacia]|uniref:hypothetical protein n=1 Tax=Burkholderia cenocepacia TaxID=95486 RepID=UPI000FD85CC7|nr:hypothetical protein [Burkholderia cenocepacia]